LSHTQNRICIQINYDLLIIPALNTDNAESCVPSGTYSELFNVVGILLRDHLTKKMFMKTGRLLAARLGALGVACAVHETIGGEEPAPGIPRWPGEGCLNDSDAA
jgi:hypothetical protein